MAANPLTSGLGPYTMDFTPVGGSDFSDLVTPVSPAVPAFQDATGVRGLTVSQGSYKVWFLAFPWEAISSAAGRLAILQNALTDLGILQNRPTFVPFVH